MTDAGAPWADEAAPAASGGGPPSRFYLRGPRLIVAAVAIVLGGACILFGTQATGLGLADPLAQKGVLLAALGSLEGLWPDIARLRYRGQVRAAGGEPWRAPGLWAPVAKLSLERRPRGSSDSRKRVFVVAVAVALASLLAVQVVASLYFPPSDAAAFVLVVSIVALVVGALVVRGRRYAVVVGFASFPWRVGERVQVQIRLGERVSQSGGAPVVSLQCVRGELSRGPAGWASTAIQILLPADSWPVPGTPGVVAVEFDLPPDAPGTDLLSLPAHTWQLIVSVETPDGAWVGQVPAPVFSRAAPSLAPSSA